jgi:predicted outer membrane repeat protein
MAHAWGGVMNNRMNWSAAVIAAAMVLASAAQADTRYVDDDGSVGGDGLTWATCYRFLQDALAEAAGDPSITEIRVAQGIYTPDRDEANPEPPTNCCASHRPDPGCDDADCEAAVCAIDPFCCDNYWDSYCAQLAVDICDIECSRHASFQLRNGLSLMGGYAGLGAGDPDERDIALYETILSGDLRGDDSGWPKDDNSYHVVTGSGTDGTALLDGFTVTAGHANGHWQDHTTRGGGMYNEAGSPTVTDCTFSGNAAEGFRSYGGGMYNEAGNPTVTDCTFSGNIAEGHRGYGGGIANWNSSPTVTNCTFSGNEASHYGGGMYGGGTVTDCTFISNSADGGGGMYGGSTVTDCSFSGNSAYYGGGLAAWGSATVTDCTFSENSARYGGGMDNWGSSPSVTNCTFSGNQALMRGGGMNNFNSNSTVANCRFNENWTTFGPGGGMSNGWGAPTVTRCTFSGNSASSRYSGGGGGMHNENSNPTVTDCTFSGNIVESWYGYRGYGGGMANQDNSNPEVNDCRFMDNWAEVGGGGMYNDESSPTVNDCRFERNTADEGSGGGIMTENGNAIISDSRFCENAPDHVWGPWDGDDNSFYTVCRLIGFDTIDVEMDEILNLLDH